MAQLRSEHILGTTQTHTKIQHLPCRAFILSTVRWREKGIIHIPVLQVRKLGFKYKIVFFFCIISINRDY